MTRAPAVLVSDRKLLLTHLDMHPGTVNADLEPAEVGIVGDTSHVQQGNSYHLGKPEQASTGYAATESPRDKAGLSDLASAFDVGWFEWRNPKTGVTHTLRTFSAWAVRQCEANTLDSRDIREIIYSLDGKTVKRWDRLKRRSTGDSSHLSHTHFSLFRDATKAGRGLTALLTRYLTEIGLLAGKDDDMTPEQYKTLEAVDVRLREFLLLADSIPKGKDPSGAAFDLPAAKAIKALRDRPQAQFTADQVNTLGLQLSEAVTTGPLTVRLPDDQVNTIINRLADLFAARLKD